MCPLPDEQGQQFLISQHVARADGAIRATRLYRGEGYSTSLDGQQLLQAACLLLKRLACLPCQESSRQLHKVYINIMRWLNLQRPNGVFSCPRVAGGDNHKKLQQHIDLLASMSTESIQQLSCVLSMFQQKTGMHLNSDDALNLQTECATSLLLVNAALGSIKLAESACKVWTEQLQALTTRDDSVLAQVWNMSMALLQVRCDSCCANDQS